ncbi:glycosyltransferase [Halanaerobium congolense]|uniref:glycosyltransferase n=1 Tax=Halanaerobium congolense TaxID=54121 RepID=UPI000886D89F|nr:glycosyltransferase [Halanaerobium congolense]SDL03084.1 Glycosyltransferase involved in cell wall bisynthesis [Halanaerobium congolense]SDN12219.1 Glycosyltransferase involved in cell wall bisynthesis [Halanaerobium congolense]
MNILFFYNSSLDPITGGIGRVSTVLAKYFDSKGNNTFFLSRINTTKNNNDRQDYLVDQEKYFTDKNCEFLKSYLLKNKIDIIINQSGMSNIASQFIFQAKELDIPIISVIHNTLIGSIKNFSSAYYDRFSKLNLQFLLKYTDSKYIKKIILFLYKLKYREHYQELVNKSDKVVLLSNSFVSELEFFVGDGYREKIAAISNPISFDVDNCSIDINKKEKEILYVGVVNFSQKRVDLLIEIWNNLCDDYSDWKLRIVGGGPGLCEAKNLANELNLKNIFFEGFQDPKSYYENASIFCMTSSFEGFGIVLVEAMQYGVVPVAFNSFASVTDIIDSETSGLLIPTFDIEKYKNKLRKLIENEEYRYKLANNALDKSSEFSIKKIGDQWLNLFKSLGSLTNVVKSK